MKKLNWGRRNGLRGSDRFDEVLWQVSATNCELVYMTNVRARVLRSPQYVMAAFISFR